MKQEAMPSMRLLQFAGMLQEEQMFAHTTVHYIAPESFQDLAEIMYISMCGTGAGCRLKVRTFKSFHKLNIRQDKKLPTLCNSRQQRRLGRRSCSWNEYLG